MRLPRSDDPPVNPRFRVLIVAFCAMCSLLPACSRLKPGPCSHLSTAANGPTKEEYLPCADAILTSMDHLDQALEKASTKDESARQDALLAMSHVRSLIVKAGGVNRLRAHWADDKLNEMNAHICGAYEVYALEMFALAHPMKKLRGEVSMHNVGLARKEADQARTCYGYLK